jgi:PHD/YefM family antitoxin component YafN of YafNO toxin-antitoxin module
VAKVDTERIVSITDVSVKGVSALVDDVITHDYTIISRRNAPAAALVSMKYFSHLREAESRLEEEYEDSRDWMLAVARVVTDDGTRHSLDAVLEKLGYTREELLALPD